MISMDANKKMIQQKLAVESGKIVYSKRSDKYRSIHEKDNDP